MLAAKSHYTGPADDLKMGNFRQFSQKIVLDAIGKGGVLSVVTQILEWQHRNPGC
jgi:hypothetical protein